MFKSPGCDMASKRQTVDPVLLWFCDEDTDAVKGRQLETSELYGDLVLGLFAHTRARRLAISS